MDLFISSAYAQAAGATAAPNPLMSFLPLVVLFGVFYFMLIRPQKRREKERQALLNAVKTGDRVLFGGGLLGVVANVKDKTLIVKIADGVKVEIVRGAVSQVLDKGEAPEQGAQA